MNVQPDLETEISRVVSARKAEFYGLRRVDEPPEHDQLRAIAEIVRSLPASEIWRFCEQIRQPRLDRVLVSWAFAYLERD